MPLIQIKQQNQTGYLYNKIFNLKITYHKNGAKWADTLTD